MTRPAMTWGLGPVKCDHPSKFYDPADMFNGAIPKAVKVPGIKENGLKQQEKILEAIRSRDPELAREYTRENVGRWSEIYLRAFENVK
jgi:DNA-binding GntR family transcriptional regulator